MGEVKIADMVDKLESRLGFNKVKQSERVKISQLAKELTDAYKSAGVSPIRRQPDHLHDSQLRNLHQSSAKNLN